MKKVYIVQAMTGIPHEDILAMRHKIKKAAIATLGEDVQILDTYTPGGCSNPLLYLTVALSKMPEADIVVAAPHTSFSKGCRIELTIAHEYGIPILYLAENKAGDLNVQTTEI